MCFGRKEPIKVQMFETFEKKNSRVKIHQITHDSFEKTSQILTGILHHSSLS